jgi:pyruvate/2-oxoglutarate dehydrogenase complex dihydrolipoamide acyltransferase (E2) component
MIYRLTVPTTFEDNQAVRVLEWHGAPGTAFPAGALIVEVETHKALVEIRGEQAAVLRRQCYAEGEWCPLGDVLALLSDSADEPLAETEADWPADFRIG